MFASVARCAQSREVGGRKRAKMNFDFGPFLADVSREKEARDAE